MKRTKFFHELDPRSFPVTQVDDRMIGKQNRECPGLITQKLSQTFKEFAAGRTSSIWLHETNEDGANQDRASKPRS